MLTDNANQADPRPSLRESGLEASRANYEAMAAAGGDSPELASVDDRAIPGPAGEIPVRIYTPKGDAPFPIVVFFHGGGFTIGSLNTHDPLARQLCAQVEALVVSVDYRLAPEHKFPAAVEDCFAATQWVGQHGRELGGDPTRIAVVGDSAGGNLSAVTCLLARDAGGPAIAFQGLIYPTTDARGGYPSIEENADSIFLSADSMRWFYEQYSRTDDDKFDWRTSPILATDLANLPPALIMTGQYDTLRDEGEAYAEALRAAGNDVTVRRYETMPHVFMQMWGILDIAKQATVELATAIRLAFGTAAA